MNNDNFYAYFSAIARNCTRNGYYSIHDGTSKQLSILKRFPGEKKTHMHLMNLIFAFATLFACY